jgi:hypothetical protein
LRRGNVGLESRWAHYQKHFAENANYFFEMWLPIESKYNGSILVVMIDELGLLKMSAMRGKDPPYFLLCALKVCPRLLNAHDWTFTFGVWAHSKLPATIDWKLT